MDRDDLDTYVVWLDNFMLLFCCLVLWLVTPDALPQTNPVGSLTVEVRWPDGMDSDVDLWVQAPTDKVVGYTRKNGTIVDLLRDDLGMIHDPGSLNFEMAVARGIPSGDYAVNLYYYAGRPSVPVNDIEVTVTLNPGSSTSIIYHDKVSLKKAGDEITVVRFHLDDDHKVSNVNHVFQRIAGS